MDLLRAPKCTDSTCKTVAFPPYRFYPDKKVHVQVTVNHMKMNDSVTVHDAVTSWTENVNTKNFTICVMQAGRSGESVNPFSTVDWLAYQGAPPKGMTGTVKIQKWWSGTKCEDVTFPKVGENSLHNCLFSQRIALFTVMCLATWPFSGSGAIKLTLLSYKPYCSSYANHAVFKAWKFVRKQSQPPFHLKARAVQTRQKDQNRL